MQFGLIEMWYAMGYVAKFVAILLISLSIITLYLFVERLIVFARAKSSDSCQQEGIPGQPSGPDNRSRNQGVH